MTLLFLWLKRREKKTPKHQTRILTLKNISVQTEDSLQVITNSKHLIFKLPVTKQRPESSNIQTIFCQYLYEQVGIQLKSKVCIMFIQTSNVKVFLPSLPLWMFITSGGFSDPFSCCLLDLSRHTHTTIL